MTTAATWEDISWLSRPQRRIFTSDARFRVVIAGRRSGKTTLDINSLLYEAQRDYERECWYVAPTYNMAKRLVWDKLKLAVPRSHYLKANDTEMVMTLRGYRSNIRCLGAENYNALLGSGLDFLIMDEFPDMDEEAWERVLQPALADRMGEALFTATPRGFNWGYDLYMRGVRGEEGWASFQYTTLEGGQVPAAEIARARAQMDPRIFRQEYEASFEAMTGRVYIGYDRVLNLDPSVVDVGGPLLVGMDFNVNPMTLVIAQRVADECHVLDGLEVMTSNTEEVATELRSRYPGRDIIVYPDPSGKARKTSAPVGQTDFTILQAAGFALMAPEAAPPVVDRVNAVNAMLCAADGRRRLRIHPRALSLTKAMDGLTYKEGTSLIDKRNPGIHITDALGYLIWSEFNTLTYGWTESDFALHP